MVIYDQSVFFPIYILIIVIIISYKWTTPWFFVNRDYTMMAAQPITYKCQPYFCVINKRQFVTINPEDLQQTMTFYWCGYYQPIIVYNIVYNVIYDYISSSNSSYCYILLYFCSLHVSSVMTEPEERDHLHEFWSISLFFFKRTNAN